MRHLLAIAAALALALPVYAQQASTEIVDHDDTVTTFEPADEGLLRYPDNTPEDWWNYRPLELDPNSGGKHTGPIEAVMYDPATGTETYYPSPRSRYATSGWVAGYEVGDEVNESMMRSFGQLSEITNTSSFPWSGHGRMWFTQNGGSFVCSGTLIDAKSYITAGHCVSDGAGNWSSGISYAPGWQPPGNDDNFGSANAVTWVTWSNWHNNADFAGDQAYVRLDRPVGFLTSWFGYGWNSDNAWWSATTFNMAGYPGGGSWNNAPNAQYYGFGNWDLVATSVVEADAPPFTYWIGGMSGGGVYWISGSSRYVEANISYGWGQGSNVTTRFGANRMTQTKFDYVLNTFIPGAYPTTDADYVPLDCNADMGGAYVVAGSNLVDFNYLVTNCSLYNPPSQSHNVDVRLSANDNITTIDTLIQNHNYTWDFGAKSSVRVNAGGSVNIPASTNTGHYWVGVIHNTPNYSTANDDTDGWDAAEIDVVKWWPNIPGSFKSVNGNYYESFDGIAGSLPSHMALNRLNSATRLTDSEAWANIGQLGTPIEPFSGAYNLEMGLDPTSVNYHDVSNSLVIGLNGNGATALYLDFMAQDWGEEASADDGVWISSNGTTWTLIYSNWGALAATWQDVRNIALHGNGVSVSGNFYLMFAQQDNFPFRNADGVAIDDIRIHTQGPTLSSSTLVVGQTGTLSITGGTPNTNVFLAYTARGAGPTATQYGPLHLKSPWTALPAIRLNGSGVGALSGRVGGQAGVTLYMHGIEFPSQRWTNPLAVVLQ
ncbi:MAG TPA: hypothetical protein VGC54_07835 [Planctomycetota bacterium]